MAGWQADAGRTRKDAAQKAALTRQKTAQKVPPKKGATAAGVQANEPEDQDKDKEKEKEKKKKQKKEKLTGMETCMRRTEKYLMEEADECLGYHPPMAAPLTAYVHHKVWESLWH